MDSGYSILLMKSNETEIHFNTLRVQEGSSLRAVVMNELAECQVGAARVEANELLTARKHGL